MKQGENPQRGEAHDAITAARVFVVVYVPHLSGFFSEMETVLRMSLDSLERTVDARLGRITLISNASCPEIERLLLDRQSDQFDQVYLNRTNRGKIDGLLPAARGALEQVVVLSDCDVLFRPGWLEEIFRVFSVFPEAASVTPIASPRRYFYETRTTLLDAALKRELGVKRRMPEVDFDRITERSVHPEMQLRFRSGQATISRNGYDAGIAGGHQCIAFRSEVLRTLPVTPCRALLEPHADRDYLDRPPDLQGYWRLSTTRHYAFHMGNVPTPWMHEVAKETASPPAPPLPLPPLRKPLVGRLPYPIRRKLARVVHWTLSRQLAAA